MIDTKKKKRKKGSISEEDISFLLQRYTATTILALLQEVAQFADVKIDWNTLVKKTSTGITNAREYQMLWRHLAYRDTLVEKLADEAEPVDDDSDIEYELEAFPPVSSEASTEAAACVKVLIASGLQSESGPANCSTVEAPLTINIPNGQASRTTSVNPQVPCSTQGTNITVPVSVQKQPLPTTTSAEGLDGNGSASGTLPPRRKRKLWTAEEDMELIAAVKKCGEGNWANILKGDFKGDRTASQLSQRWAIIKKHKKNLKIGGPGTSTGSQLSEAQLAARRAVSLALDRPMKDSLSASCSVAVTHPGIPSSSSVQPGPPVEASSTSITPLDASTKFAASTSFSQTVNQAQQGPLQTAAPLQRGTSSTTPKTRVAIKKVSSTPVTSSVGPNPLVQAAAVAAGARIATPSTAASLLKAAQSKNAVHIRPGGCSLVKTSVPAGTKLSNTSHVGPRSNLHYVRTSLASPPPTYSGGMPSVPLPSVSQPTYGNLVRPAAATSKPPPTSVASSSSLSTQQTMPASSGKISGVISTEGVVCSSKEEVKAHGSTTEPKECAEDDPAIVPNLDAVGENQMDVVENLRDLPNMEASEDNPMAIINKDLKSQNVSETMSCLPVIEGKNEVILSETFENQSMAEKQMDMAIKEMGGIGEEQTIFENQSMTEKLKDGDG